ncbi:MAG: glycoside hydrolase family 16 protein [Kiritimatiellae bacterium]|nr:glycoside hydrolase family 16 protein [Kiritimatiellia bacterium]
MKKPAVPETATMSTGKKLRLVWNDEFDGRGLPDPAKWSYEEGFVRNREFQYYTRERSANARREKGSLVLGARLDGLRHANGVALCTSGSINTRGKASWKYGRFEIRAKLPGGIGAWPAIWMLGDNIPKVGWPRCGEIDIMEYVGHRKDQVHFTVHAQNEGRHVSKGVNVNFPTAETDFAVYVLEWERDALRFFVDGTLGLEFKRGDIAIAPWPFDKPHYLLLNLAIGGSWGAEKGIDAAIFPCRFEIDYVRVYQ